MIVINPRAGIWKGLEHYKKVLEWKEKTENEQNIKIDILLSEKDRKNGNHATILARRAVNEKYDLIVCGGGDGTANEIANGMIGSSIPVLFLQAGSGNDFSRALKIPEEITEGLDLVFNGEIKAIDVGVVNGRIFVNVFGVGFDAKIATYAEDLKKKLSFLPNHLLYLIALLRELLLKLSYPEVEVKTTQRLQIMDCWQGKITLISVANGPTCGGIFKLAPDADLTDGLLDICLINKTTRDRILRFIPKGIKGTHLVLPEVKKEKGKLPKTSHLVISSHDRLSAHADGEILSAEKSFVISVLPKALKVLVPEPRL